MDPRTIMMGLVAMRLQVEFGYYYLVNNLTECNAV